MDSTGSCHAADWLAGVMPLVRCAVSDGSRRYFLWVLRCGYIPCHYSLGRVCLSPRWQKAASPFCRKAVGTMIVYRVFVRMCVGSVLSPSLQQRPRCRSLFGLVVKWQQRMNRFSWSTNRTALAYLFLYYSNESGRWRNQMRSSADHGWEQSWRGGSYPAVIEVIFSLWEENKANSEGSVRTLFKHVNYSWESDRAVFHPILRMEREKRRCKWKWTDRC